jgi:hypothetical protein
VLGHLGVELEKVERDGSRLPLHMVERPRRPVHDRHRELPPAGFGQQCGVRLSADA